MILAAEVGPCVVLADGDDRAAYLAGADEHVEHRLAYLLVTPRMHGIHHSRVVDEMDSNWSSGLSVWDRLHGTLRQDIPDDAIEIGVASLEDPSRVSLLRMLVEPTKPEEF